MIGTVAQIQGAVVDCEFSPDNLPDIYEAVEIPRERSESLVLEVQKHLGNNLVRCVAMDATEGLRRGLAALYSDSDVGHGCAVRRAVPVVLTCGNQNNIALGNR